MCGKYSLTKFANFLINVLRTEFATTFSRKSTIMNHLTTDLTDVFFILVAAKCVTVYHHVFATFSPVQLNFMAVFYSIFRRRQRKIMTNFYIDSLLNKFVLPFKSLTRVKDGL